MAIRLGLAVTAQPASPMDDHHSDDHNSDKKASGRLAAGWFDGNDDNTASMIMTMTIMMKQLLWMLSVAASSLLQTDDSSF